MNWGNKIAILYISFACLMATMVVLAINQKDIFLVQTDYYKQEIAYQDRIEEIRNAKDCKLYVITKGRELQISNSGTNKPLTGRVVIFRPSDAKLDDTLFFEVRANSAKTLPLEKYPTGFYKLMVTWTEGNKPCYKESSIYL